MRRGLLRRTTLAGLAALALAACRVDTTVDVTVTPDGSGMVAVTVIADAEAVAAAPGLAEDLRTEDLVASGWTVDGPSSTADGGLEVVVSHAFASIAEGNALLAQLSSPTGALKDLAVAVTGTSGEVEWTFTGRLDLSQGLDAFADQDLVALVGGTPWQDVVTAKDLAPADAASLTLRASLPGTREVEPGVTAPPGAAEWSASPGDDAILMSARTLASSQEVEDARRLERRMVNLLLGYGALVLAGVAVYRIVRSRRRRSRRPPPQRSAR